jgi:hypothetical protein
MAYDEYGVPISPNCPDFRPVGLNEWPGCRSVMQVGDDLDVGLILFVPDSVPLSADLLGVAS